MISIDKCCLFSIFCFNIAFTAYNQPLSVANPVPTLAILLFLTSCHSKSNIVIVVVFIRLAGCNITATVHVQYTLCQPLKNLPSNMLSKTEGRTAHKYRRCCPHFFAKKPSPTYYWQQTCARNIKRTIIYHEPPQTMKNRGLGHQKKQVIYHTNL